MKEILDYDRWVYWLAGIPLPKADIQGDLNKLMTADKENKEAALLKEKLVQGSIASMREQLRNQIPAPGAADVVTIRRQDLINLLEAPAALEALLEEIDPRHNYPYAGQAAEVILARHEENTATIRRQGDALMVQRHEVRWFAGQMEAKLKANDHKGGWNRCELMYLWARAHEELGEVVGALMQEKTADEIIKECADVANMVMMIADNVRQGAKR